MLNTLVLAADFELLRPVIHLGQPRRCDPWLADGRFSGEMVGGKSFGVIFLRNVSISTLVSNLQ